VEDISWKHEYYGFSYIVKTPMDFGGLKLTQYQSGDKSINQLVGLLGDKMC